VALRPPVPTSPSALPSSFCTALFFATLAMGKLTKPAPLTGNGEIQAIEVWSVISPVCWMLALAVIVHDLVDVSSVECECAYRNARPGFWYGLLQCTAALLVLSSLVYVCHLSLENVRRNGDAYDDRPTTTAPPSPIDSPSNTDDRPRRPSLLLKRESLPSPHLPNGYHPAGPSRQPQESATMRLARQRLDPERLSRALETVSEQYITLQKEHESLRNAYEHLATRHQPARPQLPPPVPSALLILTHPRWTLLVYAPVALAGVLALRALIDGVFGSQHLSLARELSVARAGEVRWNAASAIASSVAGIADARAMSLKWGVVDRVVQLFSPPAAAQPAAASSLLHILSRPLKGILW